MTLLTYLFILVFLIGLYFYAKCSDPKYTEALTNNTNKPRCPDILIQKNSNFYLYNSKVAKVPGVNPVEFDNLEEYTEFLDWQRSQGIRCPVLYLQETYDVQGNPVYKVRPSVSEPQAGLPPIHDNSTLGIPNTPAYPSDGPVYQNPTLLVDATRNDPPYNTNSVPAHDQTDYYVGTTTPLDQMNEQQENMLYSPDPMDSNWGGPQYTQSLIDKGYYAEDNVKIAVA